MTRLGFRAAGAALLVGAFALSLGVRMSPLVETALWGALCVASFAGWGAALKRALFRGASVDVGLLVAWGASVVCVLGGLLGALSLLRRPALVAVVALGVALAAWALVRPDGARRHGARATLRLARRHALFMLVAAITAGIVGFHYFAAIADWHVNPYDDEIAYLAFVKKLLDTGTFPEPYSLRRLSALGGQIVFVALVAPRAAMSQGHTFDHGVCVVMIALLVAGYRGARTPSLLFRMAAAVFLCVVPNMAINTASYFSGVVFTLALYRTLVFLERREGRSPWRAALVLALLSATLCTLRQNYLPLPVLLLGTSYAFLVTRGGRPWLARLREPLLAGAFTLLALAPYFAMGWVSNRTALFPILMGDANPVLQLKATDSTFAREASMAIQTLLDGVPVRTLPLLWILFALVRERRTRRPTWALAVGVFGSFAMTVHAFTQADVLSLGRYVFAGAMALTLVLILESGAQMPRQPRALGRSTVAGILGIGIVLIEILELRPGVVKSYERHFANIESLARTPKLAVTASQILCEKMQAAVPPGEAMAVLVDAPLFLDYARNPIYNLDMPGYASPLVAGKPLPFFQGASKVAEYFRSQGVRYLAFVRPDRSTYHYRRDYWIERLADNAELWRSFAPYLIDTLDTLAELATRHKVLFDEHGVVVVDLEEGAHAS